MKNTGSNKQIRTAVHAILGGVSAAATAPLLAQTAAAPATGAQAPGDQVQEVVITGIRASLQKSLDIKQQAIGVVDAISAEDIGQFPDATIGSALSRIPGVTVDRGSVNLQTASGAATSTGNVTGVTVRGFGSTFNEILSDGRRIASGIGQTFDFSALSSDWVKEIQVLKTPDMSLSSGALGATLLVKFPNPLDAPGLQLRANVSGNVYENDGGVRPGAAALISDTFADDKFGILVSGDYHESHVTTHHVDVVGWKAVSNSNTTGSGPPQYLPCSSFATNPTSVFGPSGCASVGPGATGNSMVPSWYPQDMAMYYERALELRKDGRVALQWHPTDAVLVTIDDNYSSSEDKQDRFQFSTWFGAFPNATQDNNGTITDFQYTGPSDFNSFIAETYIVTNTPGINVTWDLSSKWKAELDAAQSTSKLNPNHTHGIDVDTGYGNGTNNYTGGLATSQSSNTLPYWTAIGPNSNFATNPRDPNFFGHNPFIIGSHVIPMQSEINTNKITQAKIDLTWKDESSNTKVNGGFQYTDDKFDSTQYSDFSFQGSNNNWQLWSGYGPASNNPGQGVALPSNLFTPITFSNFIPGFKGNDKLPPGVNLYNPYAVLNYLTTQPINPGFVQTNGYPVPVYPNPGVEPPINLCPSCLNNVERKQYAPFLVAEHTFGLGDMPLIANLGLRYQKTDVTSEGLFAVPVSAAVPAGDKTAYSFNFGPTTLQSVSSSYGYFLPSLDLNLLVRPDLKVRFDASRTSSPPPNLDLQPNTSYGGRVNALVANSGNPELKPYLSNNFDLGLEWYYMRNSYVSADLFFKHITQFPVNGVSEITLPIKDPSPLSHNYGNDMVFANTTIVNGESANVEGIEVTWQQMLKYGFGFQVNGTYVHTNKPFDPYNLEQGTTQFALPGIGNSANLIAFYQNYGFQARLAVQWQQRQFLTFGQEQNSGQFGTEPTFLESSTEVDFSTSYDFNSHLGLFFEALNLTNAEYHTTGRFSNQLLNAVDYGRSYTLQLRAKL